MQFPTLSSSTAGISSFLSSGAVRRVLGVLLVLDAFKDGESDLGNEEFGVQIVDRATGNYVGAMDDGAGGLLYKGNIISGNDRGAWESEIQVQTTSL